MFCSMSEIKNRNTTFSLLYIVGIVLVLYRHFCQGQNLIFEYLFITSTYLVYIFFFSSGYFYKTDSESHPFKYIWRKFLKLIVPYFIGTIAYGIIGIFVKDYLPDYPIAPFTFKTVTYISLVNGLQFFFNLGAWILVSLFLNEVIYMLLRKILKFKHKELVIFGVFLAIGIGGLYLSLDPINFEWKLFIVRLMVSLPFYSLGNIYRVYLEKIDIKISALIKLITYIAIFAVVSICNNGLPVDYVPSTGNGLTTNPMIYYLLSFASIHFWLIICTKLSKSFENNKTVDYIASHTFSIMMNHLFAVFLLKLFFYSISDHLNNFSVEAFKGDCWYLYMPYGNRGFVILYIIWAIAFSLLLSYLYSLLKKGVIKSFKSIQHVLCKK